MGIVVNLPEGVLFEPMSVTGRVTEHGIVTLRREFPVRPIGLQDLIQFNLFFLQLLGKQDDFPGKKGIP